MRRVLMIAYHFPPSLTVGRMRTVKYCKYLPEFGWEPAVVTSHPEAPYDPKLLDEIPAGTEVHRVGGGALVAGMLHAARALRGAVRACLPRRQGSTGEGVSVGSDAPGMVWYLYWPDLHASWIVPALRRALPLARKCDVIYSSGWPMSCHIIGRRLAKLTGKPWIADHRDPWTLDWTYPLRVQDRLFRWCERTCVRQCAYLVNVNEDRTRAHRKAFSFAPAEKFVTIPNGFDPADFEGLPKPPTEGPLTIAYIGALYGGRSPQGLMRAIALLRERGRGLPGQLKLRLIGDGATDHAALGRELGILDCLELSARVPYGQALKALATSHVALLLGGSKVDTISTPTKIYEYFFMGKPMMAVLPKGALWGLLAAAGVPCAAHDATEDIARILTGLLETRAAGKPLPVPKPLPGQEKYSRRYTARQMADLMDSLCIPAPCRRPGASRISS